jgi:hypothetical protein
MQMQMLSYLTKSKSSLLIKLQNNYSQIQKFLQLLPLSFLLICGLLLFENPGKAILLSLLIFVWLLVGIYTKNYLKASLILLIIVIPFNITFSLLPTEALKFTISVEGVHSNWLVPVVSVIDLFVLIAVWELFISKVFLKTEWKYIGILCLYLTFQLILHFSFVSLIDSIRLVLYSVLTFGVYSGIRLKVLDKLDFKKYTYIFQISALFQVIIANLQVMKGASIGLQFLGESVLAVQVYGVSFINFGSTVLLRGYGTFPHPNVLAGYLSFALIITLLANLKTWIKGLVSFVIILGILLTFSKIGIFTAIVILVIFLTSRLGWFSKYLKIIYGKKYLIYLFYVFLIISLILLQVLNINLPLISETQSYIDRYNLLVSSWQLLKQNLWFGIGAGNFVSLLNGIAPTNLGGYILLQPVHNIFALFMIENGIIPIIAIAIVILCVYFGRRLSNLFHTNKYTFLCIITVVILGSFDHYFLTLPQGLAMLFGIFVISLSSDIISHDI